MEFGFICQRSSMIYILVASVLLAVAVSANIQARKLSFLNEADGLVEVYWVNHQTGERALMSDPHIFPKAEFKLDSFVGHMFEIREKGGKNGCPDAPNQVCRSGTFKVSENDGQYVKIFPDYSIKFYDNKVLAREEAADLISMCQENAKRRIEQAGKDTEAAMKAMDDLVECVQGGVARRLEDINEEIAFQASIRKNIAGLLENYTCVDDSVDSSEDIEVKYFAHKGVRRKVHIKHDRPSSKIHVVENFISEDECKAMEEAAAKKLHRATVADGQGGSRLSDARKAMQAGIKVPWDKEEQDHPIARLSRRVYDYTNHVLGLDIKEQGQEDLMSIQYFGRGFDDEQPDRYTPHCDGDCTGLPHKEGTRMATMVMYCDVADRGGHTNFRNSGVHVKPEKGNAVFFSYIDPVSRVMDTGFTEHSGCPVYEGSKKIVTQWVRLGVDEENPWNSFNTLGIKHSDAKKFEEMEMVSDEL